MKQRQCGVIGGATLSCLLLFGLLGPGTAPAPIFAGEAERTREGKPADFVLMVKDNLISLKAKDASLKEVLEEIGRRKNIEVFALLPEQEKTTVGFENLPLEEAIQRLIRNYPHLIVSQEGDRRITRIIALQKGSETALNKPAAKQSAIRKGEISAKSEDKEESVTKEALPPEPFKFEFDPSELKKKRK